MSTLTIRQLDERTHARLRVQAAEHGRSVEAEVRAILDAAVNRPERNLLLSLQASMVEAGGVDIEVAAGDDGIDRPEDDEDGEVDGEDQPLAAGIGVAEDLRPIPAVERSHEKLQVLHRVRDRQGYSKPAPPHLHRGRVGVINPVYRRPRGGLHFK